MIKFDEFKYLIYKFQIHKDFDCIVEQLQAEQFFEGINFGHIPYTFTDITGQIRIIK